MKGNDLTKMDKTMKTITTFNKWLVWIIVIIALSALVPPEGTAEAGVTATDRLLACFILLLALPLVWYENKLIKEKSKKYLYTVGPSLVVFLALFDISNSLIDIPTNMWVNIGLYAAVLVLWVVILNEKQHKAYFSK